MRNLNDVVHTKFLSNHRSANHIFLMHQNIKSTDFCFERVNILLRGKKREASRGNNSEVLLELMLRMVLIDGKVKITPVFQDFSFVCIIELHL